VVSSSCPILFIFTSPLRSRLVVRPGGEKAERGGGRIQVTDAVYRLPLLERYTIPYHAHRRRREGGDVVDDERGERDLGKWRVESESSFIRRRKEGPERLPVSGVLDDIPVGTGELPTSSSRPRHSALLACLFLPFTSLRSLRFRRRARLLGWLGFSGWRCSRDFDGERGSRTSMSGSVANRVCHVDEIPGDVVLMIDHRA
jgi:hypothetical protein